MPKVWGGIRHADRRQRRHRPTNDISKRSHSGSRSKVALSQLLMRLEKLHHLRPFKGLSERKEDAIPNAEALASVHELAEMQATNTPSEAAGRQTSGASAEEQRWKVSANETAAGTQEQSGSDDAAQAAPRGESATAATPPPSATTAQKDKGTSNETETQLPSAQKVLGPAAQTHMATSIDVLPVSARTHSYVVDPLGESPMDYEVFQYEEEK